MPDDPSCQAPHAPTGAVPRTCVPFAHVPAVPVVAVPYVPVPVPSGLPVLSVAGILPDRLGNVDVTRLLDELAAGSLAGKADKAPPLAAGSLAALDASGNLLDSGATPASIKAAAVAEVVANAPGTMDTLKEIADILGSSQQTGTVLQRILDLESGKADSSSLARVATSGSYDDLTGRPAIPDAVAVDPTLAAQGAAADAKAVGDALNGKRGMADLSYSPDDWFVTGAAEMRLVRDGSVAPPRGQWTATVAGETWVLLYNGAFWRFGTRGATAEDEEAGADATSLAFDIDGYVYDLTKGSSLALTSDIPAASAATPQMDGTASAGSGTGYSRADHVHPSDTGKMDGAAAYPAWSAGVYSVGTVRSYNGRLYKVASQVVNQSVPPDSAPWWEETTIADLKQDALSQSQLAAVNSGVTSEKVATWDDYAAQIAAKVSLADLPYRLVEPGKWEFSDGQSHAVYGPTEGLSGWFYMLDDEQTGDYSNHFGTESEALSALSLTFSSVTATRASLPGHLCDRAGNRVVVTGDTTLTLPAAVPGHLRDFLVRLTVSAAGAGSAVTWTIAQGESWDAAGAPPSSFAEGTHLYHVTEVAPGVWHCEDMFAVAGKMPMYQMVAVTPSNGTLTVAPYTMATYTADMSAAAFTVAVGTGTAGTVRDCELVIDCTATGAVAPTVTWPATFHPRTDAGTDFACEAGVRNVYFISEFSTGEFAVGGWQETAGGNA